jgi:hypothetical protein
VAEWSRRWTLKPRCRHRCGFDPYVCQGFKAPSLAQGFADFPAWNIPTRLVTLREPHICKTVVHFAVGKLLRFKVRFKIRIKLRPRFRDSVGPRDSVRIRPREWLGEKTTIGHRNSENVLSIITFFFFCGCYCSYDISIHGFLFQSPWYLQSFCMINKFDLFY